MNIVFVNSSLACGGSERVIVNLANYYSEHGHSVTIITTDRGEEPYFELGKKVGRIALLKNISPSRLFSIPRKLSSIFKLRREILKSNPDIVLAFQEKTAVYTLLSLLFTGVFKVVAVRNHPEYKRLSFPFRILRKLLYKTANKVVVQTKEIKDWFTERGFKRVEVIANPLPKIQSSSKKNELEITACGRLVPQKGFDYLIRAFSRLKDVGKLRLRLLGDGRERELLIQKAKDLGIAERIIFEGSVNNPLEYYSKGGIFAFTSKYEGFPNALCEAMASGMAVVSFDCPSGPSDLINDGINGFLIKPGDEEGLKDRLNQLIQDERLRLSFGEEAEKVNEILSIEKIAQKWLDLNL